MLVEEVPYEEVRVRRFGRKEQTNERALSVALARKECAKACANSYLTVAASHKFGHSFLASSTTKESDWRCMVKRAYYRSNSTTRTMNEKNDPNETNDLGCHDNQRIQKAVMRRQC